ncbi:unnamed protein product [Brachionus calyciflorus]|uniref:Uncharacterized protein n=1 Tax=Brachionus calyciflorus TaxID=104777 RepID=A0A814I5W0_9BILA|nr:unnamed protein product [Brachionus calyciflorus]
MGGSQAKNFKNIQDKDAMQNQIYMNPYNNYYYPNMSYLNNQTYPQVQPVQTPMHPSQMYQNYTLPASYQYQNYKPTQQIQSPQKFQSLPLPQNYNPIVPTHQYPAKAASIDGSYGLSCSSSTIPSVSSQNSNHMPTGSYNYTQIRQ